MSAALLLGPAAPGSADLIRGIQYIVAGLVEIPRSALVGTASGFPIVGTALGALTGAVRSVGLVTRGALEVVGTAIPLATKLAPLIPVFL
jgi:hypothetical protein